MKNYGTLYDESHAFADKSYLYNKDFPRESERHACAFGYKAGYEQCQKDLITIIKSGKDVKIENSIK